MSWLSQPVYFFLVLGLAAILIEVIVLQLTTFWLLFIGIGALVASLVLYMIPGIGWVGGWAIFVGSTVATTLVLYKPLRKWQKAPSPIQGNDARGQKVEVVETISAEKPGKVIWSGTDWEAKLVSGGSESIESGGEAEIVEMSGITLIVK